MYQHNKNVEEPNTQDIAHGQALTTFIVLIFIYFLSLAFFGSD